MSLVRRKLRSPFAGYPLSLVMIAATTGLMVWAQPRSEVLQLSQFYLVVILACALLFGVGPAVLATFASIFAIIFFLLQPVHTLIIGTVAEALLLILIGLTSLLTIYLVFLERRQREKAVALAKSERLAREELEALHVVSEAGLSKLDFDEQIQALLKRLVHGTKADGANILLLDESSGLLKTRAAYSQGAADFGNQEMQIGEGFAGKIVATGQPAAAVSPVDRPRGMEGVTDGQTEVSLLGVPLRVHGEVIGVVQMMAIKPRQFTPREVRLLEVTADRAASAVERSDLYQQQEWDNRLLRRLIDDSPVAVAVTFGPQHQLRLANRAFETLCSCDTAKLNGTKLKDILGANAEDLLAKLDSLYQAGSIADTGVSLIRLPGEVRDALWQISVIPLPGPTGKPEAALLMGLDVTDESPSTSSSLDQVTRIHNIGEMPLLRRQSVYNSPFLENIIDNVPSLILVYDAKTFNLKLANKVFRKHLETATNPEAAIARVSDLRKLAAAVGAPEALAHIDHTGLIFSGTDIEFEGFDGMTKHWDFSAVSVTGANGEPESVIVIAVEVTEKLKARQQISRFAEEAQQAAALLQASNEELVQANLRLQAIIENMPEGVLIADSIGTIFLGNKKAEEILGGPPISYETTFAAFDSDGNPLASKDHPIIRSLLSGKAYTSEEVRIRRDSGEEAILLVNTTPLSDAEGNTSGAVSVFQDITKMKEFDQLKDEFMSIASHELKTPLTSIKGYTQLILRRAKQVPEDRRQDTRLLAMVDEQADKMNGLISDLLDLSRIQTGRLQLKTGTVDLNHLVRTTVQTLQETTEKHTICYECNAGPVVGQWDPERIEQVILNLLTNAIKYSPAGGPIEVRLKSNGRAVEISVQDQGMGIPVESQKHLFQRFYRASNVSPLSYGGLGIGLYISKEIVKLHGGEIWAISEEGKGSTFYVRLPLTT